jgi:type II secretory pathway component GspD/PulD (secretin)
MAMTKTQALRFVPAFAVLVAASIAFSQQPAPAPAPASQPPVRSASGARYNTSGDRIVDFFDVYAADLRSVLRQISAYSGMDIVSSDAAKTNVTLSVTNKSWREVLAIVCLVHNLVSVEDKGFIYVMTQAEAAQRGIGTGASAGAGVQSSPLTPAHGSAAEALSPLVREVIPMRYVTAAEMSAAITPFLSPRGKLTTVQHTNSLILVDTDENLRQVKSLIGQIDIQTVQISISCKIIEVSSGMTQNLGINWGYTDAGNNVTAGQFWPGAPPIFSPSDHTVTYGVLSPEKFGITLNYLMRDSKTEVVAQPQITTLNNKEANVFMGQQIPINTKDEANNTITQMVNAGTRLTVTPFVAGDGKIMLSLNPSKESLGPVNADGTPSINQQSATTTVLVNNGETVVIAGLTSNDKSNEESGIPILKNIPIIGNLFKTSGKRANKTDVIIFVTPHIIHADM